MEFSLLSPWTDYMTGTLNRKRLMYRYWCSSHFVSVNIEFITDMLLRGVASPIRQAQNETSAMDTNSKDDYFAAFAGKFLIRQMVQKRIGLL